MLCHLFSCFFSRRFLLLLGSIVCLFFGGDILAVNYLSVCTLHLGPGLLNCPVTNPSGAGRGSCPPLRRLHPATLCQSLPLTTRCQLGLRLSSQGGQPMVGCRFYGSPAPSCPSSRSTTGLFTLLPGFHSPARHGWSDHDVAGGGSSGLQDIQRWPVSAWVA